MTRAQMQVFLDELLDAARFSDYCPNGLQVEGKPRIARVVSGVTASAALIRAAAKAGADALLVHHGYFWRGEDPRLLGTRRERIRLLIEHDLNLFAYHLPLDAHPELGNNAQLAKVLGLRVDRRFGKDGLGFVCDLESPLTRAGLVARVRRRLGRVPLAVGEPPVKISRIAWCTGAAQDMIEQAHEQGAQAFISGEISERITHFAREAGILYLAAGHHATERYGVQAVGQALAARFGIEHVHIDDPNPV
ncbi:MAG: Nif3-like dinuclear metal center hexameric protein [Quisquiliibacterium sp.]